MLKINVGRLTLVVYYRELQG